MVERSFEEEVIDAMYVEVVADIFMSYGYGISLIRRILPILHTLRLCRSNPMEFTPPDVRALNEQRVALQFEKTVHDNLAKGISLAKSLEIALEQLRNIGLPEPIVHTISTGKGHKVTAEWTLTCKEWMIPHEPKQQTD